MILRTLVVIINRGFATMSDVRGRDKNTEDSEKFFAGGSEHRFVDVCVFLVARQWSFVAVGNLSLVLRSQRNQKRLPQSCLKQRSSKDWCHTTGHGVCTSFL